MALTTNTWTERSAVAFSQATLATTNDLIAEVQGQINRGVLTASTTPTTGQVTNWLIKAKHRLMELYGFTWKRKFSYTDTTASYYRYALPKDFAGGGAVLRDLTQNERLTPMNPVAFDTTYPDVAGSSNGTPDYYCIKDRELWLSAPADGTYRLELEYTRSGSDSSGELWDYIPEAKLFDLADYATFRALIVLKEYQSAQAYSVEWMTGINMGKKTDGQKKWAQLNYMIPNWHYTK